MADIPIHIEIKSAQKIYEPGPKGVAVARVTAMKYADRVATLSELESELAAAVKKCSGDFDDILPFKDDGNGESKSEFYTEGVMRKKGKKIEISYEESELSGMQGSKTSVLFDPETPSTVYMMRRGTVRSNMIFEANTRMNCTYNAGPIPFNICLATSTVKNGVTVENGGFMDIVYATEINGSTTQKNRFRITVTRDDLRK